MKNYTFILILSFILVNCQNASNNEYKVLKGATIFDGNGNTIANGIIVIKEGLIEAIGDQSIDIPSGSDIKDYSGKYITPGLIDTHIHIGSSGFFDAHGPRILADSFPVSEVLPRQRYEYQRYFESYLRSGITAVYNVGGQTWTLDLQHNNVNNPNSPHFFTTGQIINTNSIIDPDFITPESELEGRKIVETQTALGANGIKIYELNLENEEHLKIIQAVADEVKIRNNRIVAHALNLDGAKEVLRLGATLLVHSVMDTLIDSEFIKLAKANKIVYTPNLCVIYGYQNAWNSLAGTPFKINDPNNVIDSETRDKLERAPALGQALDSIMIKNNVKMFKSFNDKVKDYGIPNLKKIHENGILISIGTDSGNPGTLHGLSYIEELENIQQAGIPPEEIIVMATKNGAIAINKEVYIGTLEKGKVADLVVMDENPSKDISNFRTITHVMHLGVLRSVKEKFE